MTGSKLKNDACCIEAAAARFSWRSSAKIGLLLGTALAVALPTVAMAVDVSNEQQLRDAITAANSGGDPNITLTGDIVLASNTAFPIATAAITIDTNGHDISGFDLPDSNTGNSNPGGTVTFPGTVAFINSGDLTGGGAEQNTLPFYSSGQGGTSLSLSGGNLTNNGTITGGTGGENLTGAGGASTGGTGAVLSGGNHVNNGTIKGGAGGTFDDLVFGDTAKGGNAVALSNGTLVNNVNGTIEAGDALGRGTSLPAVLLSGTTTLTNYGTIVGASQVGTNSITSGNQAIQANNGDHTIYNFGSIQGGDSANTSQAILGTPFGSARLTIVNAGVIEAGVPGNGIAIQYGNMANNQLELRAGSQITGTVLASASSTTDLFRLGGDSSCTIGDAACTFDVSSIGAAQQYRNFNIFEKTGTGTWTIAGQGTNQVAAWDLISGTMFMGAGSDLGNGGLDIIGGTLAGFGTVGTTSLAAAGTISPGGDSIGTLTIDGNYVGSGGLLQIQTVLGDDDSATDRLVVSGNSTGTTNVTVTNMGGAGGVTTDGIKVVDVGGTSDGTFSLIGDLLIGGEQAVVGGAYLYGLYQGTPTDADGDWYLRNLANPDDPDAALFQPGAPVIEAYGAALQDYLGAETLQQRLGSRSWMDDHEVGIWGRMIGDVASVGPDGSTTGAGRNFTTWRLQAGTDGVISRSGDGTLTGGVHVEVGTISADVASAAGDGSVGATGYGLGATVTYRGESGFYLDGLAKVTWFDGELTSDTLGALVSGNGGFGYALSLEAGHKVELGGNWSVTPQAQLSYSAVDYDAFSDTFGAEVALSQGDSLEGRIGVSADYETSWQSENGETGSTHLYGIANLYYELLDGTEATIAGDTIASASVPLRGGVGVGGALKLADDQLSLYGEASFSTSLDGADSHSTGLTAGLRGKF